jgi:uncharacterized membrane protein
VFGLRGATQLRAFLWENGKIRDLKTLGGPDSFAFYINNRGQVAGVTLTDAVINPSTQSPTVAPFLWENDEMKNLGSLGGLSGNVAGLNNNGQVAGNSNLPGDQAQLGFLSCSTCSHSASPTQKSECGSLGSEHTFTD